MVIVANIQLKQCYINSRYLPSIDEWPPYQPRHYTTLALIHHKEKYTNATVISVTHKLAVSGRIEPKLKPFSDSVPLQMYSNTTKNISDIFVSVTASNGPTTNPSIILIEGAPGIGKTVLTKEIAFQWANNKLLTDKKILLLLYLRQCNFKVMVSVESFVQHAIKSSQITMGLTKYLLQTEGKDLAIVLDGYDEISEEDRKNSLITDIIYRRIFAKCCLVITSRPSTSLHLHSIVDCRVEIVGFTEEDRLDYIQTSLQGNDNKIEALTLYLQSNPTINALCYIPLNMTILLCLFESGMDKLPKTQTGMYKKFIEMSIFRFIQKFDVQVSKVISNLTKIPYPHNKVFEELTLLAYIGIKCDKIVFSLNEIEEFCPNLTANPNNWNGLGLLRAAQCFSTETAISNATFHFLHLSIQEYMAAWYISTLKHNKQIKLLKETFWEHHYYNTWMMYVGITRASSFALKHFLSGNRFQFTSKVVKASSVSNKYLKCKIKCLHLFQCLLESNNKDMIALVSQSFQGNQVDLSNQILLPRDINTFGFFLMRSLNKRWEMLNLSGCKIGQIGSSILCNGFLNKENNCITVIKKANFSYNQLNFSSLKQLFDLVKSWSTSELIIKDNHNVSKDMYQAIEDSFISSNYEIKAYLQFGSFLFACGIKAFPMFLNSASIENIYMLDCVWTPTGPEMMMIKSLKQLKLTTVHLIDTTLPIDVMKAICSRLFSQTNPPTKNLLIHNHALSDRDANEIGSVISKERMMHGILLIISKSKIQGIINTNSLSNELSNLELLNLVLSVRLMSFNHVWTYPWRRNLCCSGNINDLMIHTFINSLHKIACSNSKSQLRIVLRQKDTLIAHNVHYSSILKKIMVNMQEPLTAIYLSNCKIRSLSTEFDLLFNNNSATLTYLYIYNSPVDKNCLNMLITTLSCKEIFIHTFCHIDVDNLASMKPHCNCSIVIVTRQFMYSYKPTNKQIALALQLEPSTNMLKIFNCQGNFDIFDQIAAMLATIINNWTELDFTNCCIGEIECEILCRYFNAKEQFSTVELLKINSEKLDASVIPTLIKTVSTWKVQELSFYGNNHAIFKRFILKFKSIYSTVKQKILLFVTSNTHKVCFICNYNPNQITGLLKLHGTRTLCILNCHLSSTQVKNLIKLDSVSYICVVNSVLDEITIVEKCFVESNFSSQNSYLETH